MNDPEFTPMRRLLDKSITYHDIDAARRLAAEGLRMAEEKECLGEIFYFRAQFEIINERFGEAIVYLEKAIQANPFDGAAYNDIALCRVELGMVDGVLELFDKGIEVEPDYATIHHNKGWFLNNLGQHEEALKCLGRAIELEPDRAVTYENMAYAYESLGRVEEALKNYKKVLKLIREASEQIRKQIEQEIRRLENE